MSAAVDWRSLAEPVARIVWGAPRVETKAELRWGRNGSRVLDCEKGVWHDHEHNIGGGTLDLVPGATVNERLQWLRDRGLIPDEARKNKNGGGTPFNIIATYNYTDEAGALLFQVCRLEPKDFRQRTPDGKGGWRWKLGTARRVLYRLPEVRDAVASNRLVLIVEGEKDADNLCKLGFTATCNAGGANKWRPKYTETLRNADVIIIADNDDSGRSHVASVAAALHGVAARVRVLDLAQAWPACPAKGDISDWIVAGGTAESLAGMVNALPDWHPQNDAPGIGAPGHGPNDGGEPERKTKQADILIELTQSASLFHAPDATAYADVTIKGHRETWPIRRKGFRHWLTRAYYEREHSAPNSEAMQSALAVIEAKAQFDAPEYQVHIRVGDHDDRIYLDLADATWRVIEIDSRGWRVISNPPVRFRRAAGMKPLPIPTRGGSITALRPLLNVQRDADFVLAVAWLLASLRSRGPYPVLGASGEQGTAKSTLCGMLRALVDPNTAPLRALPRNDHELFIAATNAHVLAFDNVSDLPAWPSDTFCRLATGGGFAVRQLWTDQDEILFDAMRPIILNGIEAAVTRPDLADRGLLLTLEEIPEDCRRPELELWAEFERERPRILGTLLDAAARGLLELPSTRLAKLPRMADFALWAKACEPALWSAGTFMAAYAGNRSEAVEGVIEADLVAIAIRKLMTDHTEWSGTASELLSALAQLTPEHERNSRNWPADSTRLSGRLRRLIPSLRQASIIVAFDVRKRPRTIHLHLGQQPEHDRKPATPATGSATSDGQQGLDLDATDAAVATDARLRDCSGKQDAAAPSLFVASEAHPRTNGTGDPPCNHCGFPGKGGEPLGPYDWPGRPDGIWLHPRCEEAWYESEKGRASITPDKKVSR